MYNFKTLPNNLGYKPLRQAATGVAMADKCKGSVQIRFEILEYLFFSGKNQLRTHVWRKATDASYDDFLKHLLYLKGKGFIDEAAEGQVLITAAGRKIYLLNALAKMTQIITDAGGNVVQLFTMFRSQRSMDLLREEAAIGVQT